MADDFDPKNNQIDKLNEEKKYDEAIASANKLLETPRSDNDTAEIYCSRGDAYLYKQDYDKAIADYTKAIDLKPDFATAYNSRGVAYRHNHDYDKAITNYTKAIELKPDYATAYNNRGRVYNTQNEYDKAIADYTEAVRLKPDYAIAYNNRGCVYEQMRDYDKAIADYIKAIELNPNFAIAYYNRGVLYNLQENYDKAIPDFKQAIKIDPDALVYKNLGISYYYCNQIINSFDALAESLRLDPVSPTAKSSFLFVAEQILAGGHYNSEVKLKDFLSKQKGSLPAELLKEILFEREEIGKFAEYWAICPGDWGIQGHFMKARNNIRKKLENIADEEQKKSAEDVLDAVLDSVRKLYLKLKVAPADVQGEKGEGEICLYQYTQEALAKPLPV